MAPGTVIRDMRGTIKNRVGIENRPPIVDRKIRIGDWQRGLNENTNGLIRHYVPRRSDMRTLTDAQIEHILDRLK